MHLLLYQRKAAISFRDSLFRRNAIPVTALDFVALEPVAGVDYVRIVQGESLCQQPA
ncbi:hypothetical protein Q4524_05145 [Alteromonas stellipolaris]|uniref:hypothetical protein n=1 Tax=Alteromonas stellipolaris TaxID=233316 RepID=UPI0026E29610|nr:hypothetical protein [Alteromonas stellipolaris]MDO6537960.1 hypothetical protein [Alteromonas stellipolaris]